MPFLDAISLIIVNKLLLANFFSDYTSEYKKDCTRQSCMATGVEKCDLEAQIWEELRANRVSGLYPISSPHISSGTRDGCGSGGGQFGRDGRSQGP